MLVGEVAYFICTDMLSPRTECRYRYWYCICENPVAYRICCPVKRPYSVFLKFHSMPFLLLFTCWQARPPVWTLLAGCLDYV
jgi:hypothetical protein